MTTLWLFRNVGLPGWSAHLSLTLNRSADIALVAGGNRKRWIVATENMKAGDIILNSDHIGRMAGKRGPPDVCGLGGRIRWLMKFCLSVAPREGDAHPLGALPVGTLINSVESEPGRGAQYIRAAGRKKAAREGRVLHFGRPGGTHGHNSLKRRPTLGPSAEEKEDKRGKRG